MHSKRGMLHFTTMSFVLHIVSAWETHGVHKLKLILKITQKNCRNDNIRILMSNILFFSYCFLHFKPAFLLNSSNYYNNLNIMLHHII